MTCEQTISYLDFLHLFTNKFPERIVHRLKLQNKTSFIVYLKKEGFTIMMNVSIGPKGGLHQQISLHNKNVTPEVDSIKIGSTLSLSPLNFDPKIELHNIKDLPSEKRYSVIIQYLKEKILLAEEDPTILKTIFKSGHFEESQIRIHTVQGGAPQ